jgi:mono/diheme cytochrome c family protein
MTPCRPERSEGSLPVQRAHGDPSLALGMTARGISFAVMLACAGALAQDKFDPKQIAKGSDLFATHCQTCHGNRMAKPEWAPVDLRRFPPADHARFVDTVTYGVRNMPPWSDVLKPEDVESLWAYVMAGEKK